MKINVRILSIVCCSLLIAHCSLLFAQAPQNGVTKTTAVDRKDSTVNNNSQPANLWFTHFVNWLNLPMWSVAASFGNNLFYGDTKQFNWFPMSNNYVNNKLIPQKDGQVPDSLKVGKTANKVTERKWGGAFYLSKQFGTALTIRGSYMFGKLGGVSYKLDPNPSYFEQMNSFGDPTGTYISYTKPYSAYYFTSNYHEFALDANVYLNSLVFPSRGNRLQLYIIAGIGDLTYNTSVSDLKTGNQINTTQAIINGLSIAEYSYANEKFKNSTVPEQKSHATSFPVGLGVKYHITPHFSAFLESTYRLTRTDALDGYSDAKTEYDAYEYTCIGISFSIGKMADSLLSRAMFHRYQLNKVKQATKSRLEARVDSIERVVGDLGHRVADLEQGDKSIRDSIGAIEKRVIYQVGNGGPLSTMTFTPADVVSQLLVVFFDFNKYNILPKYHENIALVARILKNDPKIVIEIDGHADKKGSEKYNLELSKKRVEAVANELRDKYGIDQSRLTNQVYRGKDDPLSGVYDDVNRRVDFKFTKPVTPAGK